MGMIMESHAPSSSTAPEDEMIDQQIESSNHRSAPQEREAQPMLGPYRAVTGRIPYNCAECRKEYPGHSVHFEDTTKSRSVAGSHKVCPECAAKYNATIADLAQPERLSDLLRSGAVHHKQKVRPAPFEPEPSESVPAVESQREPKPRRRTWSAAIRWGWRNIVLTTLDVTLSYRDGE